MVFYRRHVCRTDPWPDWLERCFAALAANPEVYETMNGPNEFHVIGTIRDFDVEPRPRRVDVTGAARTRAVTTRSRPPRSSA